MSDPDSDASAATWSWARSYGNAGAMRARAAAAAQAEKRVALADLTNVVAGGGRAGAADAEREVDEARKKKFSSDLEWLRGRLLEEQRLRQRAEVELSKLQGIEARAQRLELQLASRAALPSVKPDGSNDVNIPEHYVAELEKQTLTNLDKVGEATLAKVRAECATWEVSQLEHTLAAVSEERDRPRKDHAMLTKQETRDGNETSLKDMLSGLHGMDKVVRGLESTIDQLKELITHQHTELKMMNERLSIEGRKTMSLEQERGQLRSQVALLESKLCHGDYSASSTEVPCKVNTLAVDSEVKRALKKTDEWLQAVEELKGQDGGELCLEKGSCEWFFRGNKLMLSSGMKMYLKRLCGYVPPEIPFFLYQMNKSNLKRKGKMRLSAKYISKPLLSCLHNGAGYAHFDIDSEDQCTVRVNILADGRASLTSGWESVIEAKDIKVGDICAFHFKISDGVLKLSVHVFHVVRYLVCVK